MWRWLGYKSKTSGDLLYQRHLLTSKQELCWLSHTEKHTSMPNTLWLNLIKLHASRIPMAERGRREVSCITMTCVFPTNDKAYCWTNRWFLTSATGIGVEWQLSSLIPSNTCAICWTYSCIYCHRNGQSSGLSPYLPQITYAVNTPQIRILRKLFSFNFIQASIYHRYLQTK